MKITSYFITLLFLAIFSSGASAQLFLPIKQLINVYTVSCDAKWDQECKRDFQYDVPEDLPGSPQNYNCPTGIIGCLGNPMPSQKWDLCKFTMREDHAGGGSWQVNRATRRYISIHVESRGSHNVWDRWGGDVMVSIAEMTLIRQSATDEERVAYGCTRPAGICQCINNETAAHDTFRIKDFCEQTECTVACAHFGEKLGNTSFYKFLAGKGAGGMCPL